jgi:endonuclease YncB( thermonuclease family)
MNTTSQINISLVSESPCKKFFRYLKNFLCCNNYDNTRDNKYLVNVVYENTVPFVPPVNVGKVIKVYDGDTITIISKLPYTEGPIYRFLVRLNGIDSPEIKGHTVNEKELARHSRDALSNLILGKIVTLKNISTEKYGRILADVYMGDLCINDWMLTNKYAVKYDGRTKNRPDEWN